MTAAIDSNVLIYAGLVPSNDATARSDAVRELQIRSRLLILSLAKKKTTVFLPTIALAEVLVPVPAQQIGPLIAMLSERFVLPTFDIRAAAIAADLWAQHRRLPRNLQYPDRHVLRADTMIVASAKSAGAIEFYTTDDKCRALARLVMQAKELPAQSEEDMFLRGDIERGDA